MDRARKEFDQTLNGRKLRCDYAHFGLFEYEHLHSATLSIDKFSSSTKGEEMTELFRSEANVLFCQVSFIKYSSKSYPKLEASHSCQQKTRKVCGLVKSVGMEGKWQEIV